MNRKMKKLILLITIITFASSVNAYDFEVGGFYYNILSLSELTAEVTCSGEEDEYNNNTATYSGDIVIPKHCYMHHRSPILDSIVCTG